MIKKYFINNKKKEQTKISAINLKFFSLKKLRINTILNKEKKFKNNFCIDLKDENHLNEIKKQMKYEKSVLKESYMQKIILRNQILILVEKLNIVKEILNFKIIFENYIEKYHKYFINEIKLFIKFIYSIVKKLFKDSYTKINEIIYSKSPINQDIPLFYEFNSNISGLKTIKKLFNKVFDYFKDCVIAFFLICSEIKDQFFNNLEMFNLVNILDHIRYKISKFIEFYKINIKELKFPENNPKEDLYNSHRLKKYNFLIKPNKNKIIMSSRINLNKETKRRINNFSKDFKSKSPKKYFKTRIKNNNKKEINININKDNNLNNLLNYLRTNNTKLIPKHYKKLLKKNY